MSYFQAVIQQLEVQSHTFWKKWQEHINKCLELQLQLMNRLKNRPTTGDILPSIRWKNLQGTCLKLRLTKHGHDAGCYGASGSNIHADGIEYAFSNPTTSKVRKEPVG